MNIISLNFFSWRLFLSLLSTNSTASHKEKIQKTRKNITPIVDNKKLCVCVCANIPLRGHEDSTENQPEVGKCVLTNSGNLLKLL